MRKIYHIRCREVPVKANFPSAHKNILCLFPSCQNDDSQIHIYESKCFSQNEIDIDIAHFSSIYSSDVNAQVKVMNILYARLETRKQFMALSAKELPDDPRRKYSLNLGIKKAKLRKTKKTKQSSKATLSVKYHC